MSALLLVNCGEFASTKPIEFDGFSATRRCTIEKGAALSHLLGSANKSEAFSHIALREVER
jgi:hypothetical protein